MAVYKDNVRGTWYASFRVKMDDGTIKQKFKRGFKKKADALAYEQVTKLNLNNEVNKDITFNEVYLHFLDNYINEVNSSTYIQNLRIFNKYILPFFKKMKITNITPIKLNTWKNTLNQTDLKNSSKKKYMSTLKLVLKHAEKYFGFNYAALLRVDNFKNTRKNSNDISFYTIDEYKEFYSLLKKIDHQAIFATLFLTGMRKGELLGLQWKDLDTVNKTIFINKTVTKDKHNKLILGDTTKTGESRKIGIANFLIDLLHEYKLSQIEKWGELSETDLIFGNRDRIAALNKVNIILERIITTHPEVKKIRVHDFRHSHASYLINKNINIKTISARLGHATVSMTLDTYSHLYPQAEDELLHIIDADFQ